MADSQTSEFQPKREFQRSLNLFDSTTIVIGSMIGSGIFIVSSDIARTVSSPGWLLTVWLITGIVTIIAALSYGELAAMMPHAGGQYVYLRESYGSMIGFLYGWTLFLVIQTGTIAAVAVAFARYTGVLIPWFSESNKLLTLGSFSISATQLLGIASIAVLTYVNTRGITTGKTVQNIFTITKTAALLGLILLGFLIGKNAEAVAANFSNFWNAAWTQFSNGNFQIHPLSGIALAGAIGAAMVGSLFSSDAWNNITFTAGEVVNPKRTIPLGLFFGTAIVTMLYISANISYLNILPLHGSPNGATVAERGIQFATDDRVATAAAQMMFGDAAAIVMAVLIMISTFGCNNGLILAGARVYYAMSKDGLFFEKAGVLNRHSVPAFALVTQGIWASALCLSGTYSNLLDYVIFAVLIFYIFTISGLFILRKKRPDAERPYKAFGYPFIPAFYILIAAFISIDLLFVKPAYTWPGLIIVLMGIPVYWYWRRRKIPDT
ncbi:MAG: amino acid permease [Bacteroidota bacterium]|nr:amino acid permease [Bacteroidota bacterium]